MHLGMLKMHWATVLEQMSGLLVGASLIAIGLLGFKDRQRGAWVALPSFGAGFL